MFEAQRCGHLPEPCTLVMFDQHHDAVPPRTKEALDRIDELLASSPTGQDILDLCVEDLSKLDDDWITAGMSLGLLDDAVIFGVQNHVREAETFVSPGGTLHHVHMLGFPGPSLAYQGELSDHARHEELVGLWDTLDWRPGGFGTRRDRILLSIDLDAFVMSWDEFTLPWPDEVFEGRFFKQSDYSPTRGWTGRRFFDELVERAGVIAIAREPAYCGGPDKMHRVWGQVNHFLFGDRLTVS
ncbi:MAG TPA: hypothetical protein VKZ50_13645 [bacterium]|nr:hypothetical protein [bacterium]